MGDKSVVFAFVWAVLLALHGIVIGASNSVEKPSREPLTRDECVAAAAKYVAKAVIEDPVLTLVERSRIFYKDPMELIEEEIPANNYVLAMRQIGSQYGCDTLEQHIAKIHDEEKCYAKFDLDSDDNVITDMASSNPLAKDVFEAHFACRNAKS